MTVQDVLEYLAGGMTVEEILSDFPYLEPEDIRACLAFAADRERQLHMVYGADRVKLLFDENPSPKLVDWLADLFPESSHIHIENLGYSRDSEILSLRLLKIMSS